MICEKCPNKSCEFVKNGKGREEKSTDPGICIPNYKPGECDILGRQKIIDDFLSNSLIPH